MSPARLDSKRRPYDYEQPLVAPHVVDRLVRHRRVHGALSLGLGVGVG